MNFKILAQLWGTWNNPTADDLDLAALTMDWCVQRPPFFRWGPQQGCIPSDILPWASGFGSQTSSSSQRVKGTSTWPSTPWRVEENRGKTYRKMIPKPHYRRLFWKWEISKIVLNFEITSKTFRKGFDATISCFMAWNHCHVNVRYPIFKVQGFKRESHGIGRQIPLVCPEELHLAIYTTQHDKGRWRLASGQLVK